MKAKIIYENLKYDWNKVYDYVKGMIELNNIEEKDLDNLIKSIQSNENIRNSIGITNISDDDIEDAVWAAWED